MSGVVVIRGGRLIDPANGVDASGDLLVADGVIRALGRVDIPAGATILHADGLVVAPGLVDMHVHLREPGFEYKETIAGGTLAAAAGGVTTVACMPNTRPVNDDPSITAFIRQKAASEGTVNVFPIGAVTKGLEGRELTEMGLMLKAGCVAFSDDGRPVADAGLMRRALDYSRAFGALIIQHAEDPSLSAGGCMHEGVISSRLGLPGLPAAAESVMVDRDVRLVELTGGRYHVAHISVAGAVEAVARARSRGLPVSCEVAPHHFALTDEAVLGYDTDAKMSPPLRSTEDRNAVLEGLARGIITVIATDHAPHDQDSKRVEFCHASNGVVGLETMLPVSLELVRDGVMTLVDCLRAMTVTPARLLGLDRGTLSIGAPADVVLFDPDESWVVDAARLHGTSRNTCFHGRRVRGRVKWTMVSGKVVHDDRLRA
ncbi:Dihydroorotase [Candidatus Magnetaquicoccaceae bacterium FCR-1]|uniref:Dihydroorotase n=1 Tax=Candidatus Magnetaquiglobus chichijimensis TaxID=3141448 RepID=A0ABQ0CC35_9PROT